LKVYPGDSIALIGKNGAGKTTLLKILSGLIIQDRGEIVLDRKTKLSCVNTNERSFFWRLSVFENLTFFSSFDKIDKNKIREVLQIFSLDKKIDSPYMHLSSGERKKVSIVRSLLKNANLLLFDEATSSLDAISKRIFINTIKSLLDTNFISAVIFSTHSLNEALSLSNKIVLIDNGKIIKQKSTSEFKNVDDLFNFYES
jgi:ABC-type multidrug transport system ATPase subunit